MLNESYDFTFLVLVYIGSFIALISFIVFVIYLLLEYLISKKILHKFLKLSIITGLLLGLFLSVPWWFYAVAMNSNLKSAEKWFDYACKTSVFPNEKAYMYSSLGNLYFITGQGNQAINTLEKSNTFDYPSLCTIDNPKRKKHCKAHIFSNVLKLCILYTAKGETEKAITNCSIVGLSSKVAENYILAGKKEKAFEVINKRIEEKNEDADGLSYAIRGFLYRDFGERNKANTDFQSAMSNKRKNISVIERIKDNKNYFTEKQKEEKLKYNF